jgi:hypothetical protein
MTEDQAKKQLGRMVRSFTTGSVLHLLAEVCRESADAARRAGDDRRNEQLRAVEAALIVMGYGVDAACPR